MARRKKEAPLDLVAAVDGDEPLETEAVETEEAPKENKKEVPAKPEQAPAGGDVPAKYRKFQ